MVDNVEVIVVRSIAFITNAEGTIISMRVLSSVTDILRAISVFVYSIGAITDCYCKGRFTLCI